MIPVSEAGSRSDWEHWVKEFAFEHVTLAYTVSSHMSALINPDITNKIFSGSQYSFNDVHAMHNEGILSSFELQSRISFDGEFDERDFIGRNLIGMVEGRDNDLKDTYIILSAHYDHLGIAHLVAKDALSIYLHPADAMKVVTGASVVGGKYVYIRGLGDRYSSIQLNGAELPSANPDKKAFNMDMVPSKLLDNIVTKKNFSINTNLSLIHSEVTILEK